MPPLKTDLLHNRIQSLSSENGRLKRELKKFRDSSDETDRKNKRREKEFKRQVEDIKELVEEKHVLAKKLNDEEERNYYLESLLNKADHGLKVGTCSNSFSGRENLEIKSPLASPKSTSLVETEKEKVKQAKFVKNDSWSYFSDWNGTDAKDLVKLS